MGIAQRGKDWHPYFEVNNMRLHILGKNSDDRGKQLEILTKELLESLGYERLKLNVANDAGEVDVQAEFVTPLPVEPKRTKVIAECKAHKDPLNMTDWLKFLGKLFIAEANDEDVAGCLVALSGVNGNVLGSLECLKRKNVRLVESTTLIDYLSKSHGLVPIGKLQRYLASTGKTYLAFDLVYYQRRVYWVISYDGGAYTTLEADACYPTDASLGVIKPMIETQLEAGTFIDLRKEETAHRARMVARKLAISGAMLGNGSTSIEELIVLLEPHKLKDEVTPEDIQVAVTEMVQSGMLQQDSLTKRIMFPLEVETDIEIRRQLFVEFGRDGFFILPIGGDWWDKHIDENLMRHACTIQANLQLDPENQHKATALMRLSPTALIHAILPDPMIVTHHQGEVALPQSEELAAHDRNHFMRSLYDGLTSDFGKPQLSKYFHCQRQIEALARRTHLTVYNRNRDVVMDAEVSDTRMIGEWHEKSPTGEPIYVHMSALPDYAERMRAAAAAERAKNDVAPHPSVQVEEERIAPHDDPTSP